MGSACQQLVLAFGLCHYVDGALLPDQELEAARGGFLPGDAAIAEISGRMKKASAQALRVTGPSVIVRIAARRAIAFYAFSL